VPLRDTPLSSRGDPARCTAEHLSDPSACDFPRPADSIGPSWEQRVLTAASLDLPVLDLNDAICQPQVCPAVVDHVLRWRDNDHVTNAFAATLGPRFAEQLAGILGIGARGGPSPT
jgi:SGNH domain (fused to AT3 domains)